MAFGTQADTVTYRVFGSFMKADNAHGFAEQLQQEGVEAAVRFSEPHGVFRVIANAHGIPETALAAHESWLLSLSETRPSTITPAITEIAPTSIDPATIIIEAPPSAPLFPALEPEESLSAYCQRLPASELCQHPRIQHALETDKKLAPTRELLQGVCERITHPQWHQTCLELHADAG